MKRLYSIFKKKHTIEYGFKIFVSADTFYFDYPTLEERDIEFEKIYKSIKNVCHSILEFNDKNGNKVIIDKAYIKALIQTTNKEDYV